jgi:hypothetical protein
VRSLRDGGLGPTIVSVPHPLGPGPGQPR